MDKLFNGKGVNAMVSGKGSDSLEEQIRSKFTPEELDDTEFEFIVGPQIGDVLSSIQLKDLRGESVELDLANGIHLLVFWTSYCKPCHPLLQQYSEILSTNPELAANVKINTISMDWEP